MHQPVAKHHTTPHFVAGFVLFVCFCLVLVCFLVVVVAVVVVAVVVVVVVVVVVAFSLSFFRSINICLSIPTPLSFFPLSPSSLLLRSLSTNRVPIPTPVHTQTLSSLSSSSCNDDNSTVLVEILPSTCRREGK